MAANVHPQAMVVAGLCHLCSRPTVGTCVACGRPACEDHRGPDGVCATCARGRRSRRGVRG